MRKTPIIIAGIVVAGAAYLGGLYVSGSKALSDIHQLVDRTNTSQSKMRLDIQEEQRGLFSSSVKIVAADSDKKVLIDAPILLHHHLFSTDINGHLAISVDGRNLIELKDSPEESLLLQAHVKHNQDGRGSSLRISTRGKLLVDPDAPNKQWVEQPELTINRAGDGRLTISLRERASLAVLDDLQFTDSDSFSSISYDGEWVDQILPVIADNIKNNTAENKYRLATLLLSRLPDTHIEYKQWHIKGNNVDVALNDLKFDWGHEGGAIPSSHLTASLQDADIMGKHYKGAVSLRVDQRVIDTLLEARQSFDAIARYHEDAKAFEQKVATLIQSAPRLTLESLDVSGDDLKPVKAEGYLTVNGSNVNSIVDLERRAPQLFLGQLSIHNFPAQLINLTALIGMNDINAGDDVTIDTADGHVTVNGKRLF